MSDLSVDCPICGTPNAVTITGSDEYFTCVECGEESSVDAAIAAESQPQQADYLIDQIVGDCKVLKKVGEGGFGSVYLATDQHLQRSVALKVMLQSLTSDQKFVNQFTREAVTAAQLNHPNIVSIHKVGRDEKRGLHFLIMEFVEGTTLNDIVNDQGVLTVEESIPLMVQACDALATAHERNIVHRDIKPENLMVNSKGILKITDFGLAKSLSGSSNTTKVMGTPHYMSPEQFEGKAVDGRSDIYSLGVTFFYLLSKNRPYEGQNTVQIIYSILTQDPKPIQMFNPTVPDRIWEIVQKMIAKKADDRYQTLRDTITDLKSFSGKGPVDRSQCPSCGARNPKGRKFCRGCGGALLLRCPACSSQEPAGVSECGACGADIVKLLKIKKALENAERFKVTGDLRRAAESYRQVVELEPEHPEANAEIIELDQAVDQMDRVSTEAESLEMTGDLGSALGKLDELLARFPSASDLKSQRDRIKQSLAARKVNRLVEEAETAVADGNVPHALALLDSALREDPAREDVRARRSSLGEQVAQVATHRQQAAEALAAGRYEEAFALANEVLSLTPGDKAMEEVRAKASASVKSVDTFVQRGRERLDAGRLQEALGEFEAALSVRPGDKQLIDLCNSTRKRMSDHREGLHQCRRLMAERKYVEAVELLRGYLAKMPGDKETESLLTQCERGAEEAVREQSIHDALEQGQQLVKGGDLGAAIEQFTRVLELDPHNEEARGAREEAEAQLKKERDVRELANEHLQDGRYEQATQALERLRDVNPGRTMEIEAEIKQARGSKQAVVESLQTAESALKKRQYKVAAVAAQKVLDVAPRHPRAVAVSKDAGKALAAIERFLAECDRLTLSELFDEALEALDRARERGCTEDEYLQRRKVCEQGRLALLKADATQSIMMNDFEAAIAAYEQVLELQGEDGDALKGKRAAERRMRILTSEPLPLRIGAAAVVALLLGLVQFSATAATLVDEADLRRGLSAAEQASFVADVDRTQQAPEYGTAFGLEQSGDFAAASQAYQAQLDKFEGNATDSALAPGVTGRGFSDAMIAAMADSLTYEQRLAKLTDAAQLLGDLPESRRARQAIIADQKGAALRAWVSEIRETVGTDPTAALEQIQAIQENPDAKGFERKTIEAFGDAAAQFQQGDDEIAVSNYALAASAFLNARVVADDLKEVFPEASQIADERVAKLEGAWMDHLRQRERAIAADEASEQAFYDEIVKGLANYESILGVERDEVLKRFNRK